MQLVKLFNQERSDIKYGMQTQDKLFNMFLGVGLLTRIGNLLLLDYGSLCLCNLFIDIRTSRIFTVKINSKSYRYKLTRIA